ncbi:MAG TPA: hypothetical protein VHW09_26760 [Bryobacteraceae bacterium]|jgi:hypothetical protein|nr:hypothetical protein [Bryobacteraceae bacterium]
MKNKILLLPLLLAGCSQPQHFAKTVTAFPAPPAYVQEGTGEVKYLKDGDIIHEANGLCGYVQAKQ